MQRACGRIGNDELSGPGKPLQTPIVCVPGAVLLPENYSPLVTLVSLLPVLWSRRRSCQEAGQKRLVLLI